MIRLLKKHAKLALQSIFCEDFLAHEVKRRKIFQSNLPLKQWDGAVNRVTHFIVRTYASFANARSTIDVALALIEVL